MQKGAFNTEYDLVLSYKIVIFFKPLHDLDYSIASRLLIKHLITKYDQ